MLVIASSMARKFDIMHLVTSHETYKIAYGMVTQTLGRITDPLVRVGGIICQMVFLVVDIDNYRFVIGFGFSYEN
jgi:hypothetical protein